MLQRFWKLNKLHAFILFTVGYLFSGCQSNQLEIIHGNLKLELNEKMHTRIASLSENSDVINNQFQASENITIDNKIISDFKITEVTENTFNQGELSGKSWAIKGISSEGIEKSLSIKAYDQFPDLLSTTVTYRNTGDRTPSINEWINQNYTIQSNNYDPPFWAFQGSSSTERDDWIKPINSGYYQKNYMGMNDSDYGGGIPVTDIWTPNFGVSIGHLALVPKLVSLPTEIEPDANDVSIGIKKEFPYPTRFEPGSEVKTLETFVMVHKGDYYNALQSYSKLMQAKGIKIVEPEDEAFESIWCAWGYMRTFTLDEVVGTLQKVKELNIKWAVLDDGFQIAEGDWNADPKKFPRGDIEIKELVDKIHETGLKAKLWWTPLAADPHSEALKENPEMVLYREDGSPQFITWWDAYYLSPANPKTIDHTKDIINLFMKDWGFDGLKMDGQHMNAVAPDHNWKVELEYPEKSVEELPAFFQMIYDEARAIKPNAVIENCPCGTCMSYYNMASMNQAVSSDPTSSWQIRHKGKTYKALIPNTAYYGDHVELSDNGDDFATSFGIGAVLGTKFTWPRDNPDVKRSYLLTPEKEKVWKKWFSLYDEKMLSKEQYLGDLYDIGYDKPETHVISKDGILHYAFYADEWEGEIKLRGLGEGTYQIRDYFNNVDLGEVNSTNSSISASFERFLLIEALPK